MTALEEMEKSELLALKQRLLAEKMDIEDRIGRIDNALGNTAPPAPVQSDFYLGDEFTARLQKHFHRAKLAALNRTV